jgi:hypothetical protein
MTNQTEQKAKRIEELKALMDIELKNNFPNGDLWNNLSDELRELERVPSTFEIISAILNSPKDY